MLDDYIEEYNTENDSYLDNFNISTDITTESSTYVPYFFPIPILNKDEDNMSRYFQKSAIKTKYNSFKFLYTYIQDTQKLLNIGQFRKIVNAIIAFGDLDIEMITSDSTTIKKMYDIFETNFDIFSKTFLEYKDDILYYFYNSKLYTDPRIKFIINKIDTKRISKKITFKEREAIKNDFNIEKSEAYKLFSIYFGKDRLLKQTILPYLREVIKETAIKFKITTDMHRSKFVMWYEINRNLAEVKKGIEIYEQKLGRFTMFRKQ